MADGTLSQHSAPSQGTSPSLQSSLFLQSVQISMFLKSVRDVFGRANFCLSARSSERSCVAQSCTVDRDVLRGVRARRVLWFAGAVLRNNVGSEDTYGLSEPAEQIASFWSHSWRAVPRHKIATLLYVYNGFPALVGSVLAAVAAVVLAHARLLSGRICHRTACSSHGDCEIGTYCYNDYVEKFCMDHVFCCSTNGTRSIDKQCPAECIESAINPFSNVWPLLWAFVTYLLLLFFWPSNSLVFLDKVCIHQSDADKKQRGIDGLGGFLRQSKEMLLLWDDTYFTRLWCTFEIAAFCFLEHSVDHIRVLPVIRGYAITASVIILGINRLVTLVAQNLEDTVPFVSLLPPGFLIGFGAWFAHLARMYTRQLNTMEHQIAEFKPEDAECFCCTVGHKIPGTGAKIDCDRLVVYEAIQQWFPQGLLEFQDIVRSKMHANVMWSLGHMLSYRDALYICLPSLWYQFALSSHLCVSWGHMVKTLNNIFLDYLALSPLAVGMLMWLSNVTQRKRSCCDWAISLLVAILWGVLSLVQQTIIYSYASPFAWYGALGVGLIYVAIAKILLDGYSCAKRNLPPHHESRMPPQLKNSASNRDGCTPQADACHMDSTISEVRASSGGRIIRMVSL